MTADLGPLLADVQSLGVRVTGAPRSLEGRRGGAGPSDAGMIWIEGTPVTFPFSAGYVAGSPFELRPDEDGDGWALYREGRRVAGATLPGRPKFYDLTTADGIPYWKIALLHLDSLASTVVQTCVWWGTDDQCRFCGIELSLEAGRTIPVKKPHHLAEVAAAAKQLDGAVDVTLTTGTTRGADKGARYLGRCARAIKASCGLPVQAQFEPPGDLLVLEEIRDLGVDAVGMHVESFDPDVLARVAPAKARTGIEGYFAAWERAVEVFGRGQVSTYVILGMGEDRRITTDGIRRAIDIGVYPFVVPLRPVPGSLMQDFLPPAAEEVEAVYREVAPYLTSHNLRSSDVKAGCARCQACSGMAAFERGSNGPDGANRRHLPLLRTS
jgi:radical SAM protein (TIGR04043 family)